MVKCQFNRSDNECSITEDKCNVEDGLEKSCYLRKIHLEINRSKKKNGK